MIMNYKQLKKAGMYQIERIVKLKRIGYVCAWIQRVDTTDNISEKIFHYLF